MVETTVRDRKQSLTSMRNENKGGSIGKRGGPKKKIVPQRGKKTCGDKHKKIRTSAFQKKGAL